MAKARNLQDEVMQLRSDANRDRPKKRRRTTRPVVEEPAPEPETKVETDGKAAAEKLKDLSEQLNDLAHNAEDGIKDHPVAAVLGAFALGIVVGAVLRR